MMDNHYRTLHKQRYICTDQWNACCNPCCERDRFQVYVEGEGKWGSTRTRTGTYGFDYNAQIVTGGLDYFWNDCLTVGASFSAQRTNSHVKHGRGKLNLYDYVPAIYGFLSMCDFFIESDLSYHYHRFSRIRRHIPFLNRTARARTSGWSYQSNTEVGYVYQNDCMTLIPIVGVQFENLHIDGYKERGAGFLNFRVNRQNQNSLNSKVGGQVFFSLCNCCVQPFAEVFYANTSSSATAEMFTPSSSLDDNSVVYSDISRPERDMLTYSFGLYSELWYGIQGNISYLGETTFRECTNAVRAEFDVTF